MRLPTTWLGSEESAAALEADLKAYYGNRAEYAAQEEAFKAKLYADEDDDEEFSWAKETASRMISKTGNVGFISINGPMIPQASFFSYLFGYTGYDAIAEAVTMHLEDPEVQHIVAAWATPGGAASGLDGLSAHLEAAQKVKPVTSYITEAALSAGYWGAASTGEIRSGKMGQAGSIGAIAKFMSFARMLNEEGIDPLIVRSAPKKALLQREEPISEAGKEVLQKLVDTMHSHFVGFIASRRTGLSSDTSLWASGEAFFADRTIELGLVDGPVISLQDYTSQLQSRINQRTAAGTSMNLLTEQTLAQLMGSQLGQPIVPQANGGTPGDSPEENPETPDGDEGEEDETAAKGGASDAKLNGQDGSLSGYLAQRVSALEQEILGLKLTAQQTEQQLAGLKDVEEQLRPAATAAVAWAQVALGQTPMDLSQFSTAALSEAYAQARKTLDERLPSGRQSLSGEESSRSALEAPQGEVTSLEDARVSRLPVANRRGR